MQVWFFDCSHDNQGRSVIYDLINKCSDLITKSAEKTSSTFRIIDLTFWPWRFQIFVLERKLNYYLVFILIQSETKTNLNKIFCQIIEQLNLNAAIWRKNWKIKARPWRFQIIVLERILSEQIIVNQSETKKTSSKKKYIFLRWFLHLVVINVWQLVWLLE